MPQANWKPYMTTQEHFRWLLGAQVSDTDRQAKPDSTHELNRQLDDWERERRRNTPVVRPKQWYQTIAEWWRLPSMHNARTALRECAQDVWAVMRGAW